MMRPIVSRALMFAALWWVLAEGRNDAWVLGGIAVAVASWASFKLRPVPLSGLRFVALPGFLGFFLANSLRGGWQVALMALRGRAALRPSFFELPMKLPAGAGQILFINLLCLMPGTVAVDIVDGCLRLHVLHQDLPVLAEARALERHIADLFGLDA